MAVQAGGTLNQKHRHCLTLSNTYINCSPTALLARSCSVCDLEVKVKGKVHPRTGHEGPEGE